MDDLIVLILTLLVAVAGAVGQIKKKKANNRPSVGQPQKRDNFWDLLDEQVELPILQTELSDVSDIPGEDTNVSKEQHNYEFSAKDEGGSVIPAKNREPIEEVTTAPEQNRLTADKFSLRKAVIYSEILNRKYV